MRKRQQKGGSGKKIKEEKKKGKRLKGGMESEWNRLKKQKRPPKTGKGQGNAGCKQAGISR